MPQGLCCTCSNCCTGHTDRQSPTAALATQISMPQVLHWPQNSAFRKCCTGHADEHAPSAALATQIGMLQLLHWPHNPSVALATQISLPQVLHWPQRSACSKCCTGHTNQHAQSTALATQIGMLQMLHWRRGSAFPTRARSSVVFHTAHGAVHRGPLPDTAQVQPSESEMIN